MQRHEESRLESSACCGEKVVQQGRRNITALTGDIVKRIQDLAKPEHGSQQACFVRQWWRFPKCTRSLMDLCLLYAIPGTFALGGKFSCSWCDGPNSLEAGNLRTFNHLHQQYQGCQAAGAKPSKMKDIANVTKLCASWISSSSKTSSDMVTMEEAWTAITMVSRIREIWWSAICRSWHTSPCFGLPAQVQGCGGWLSQTDSSPGWKLWSSQHSQVLGVQMKVSNTKHLLLSTKVGCSVKAHYWLLSNFAFFWGGLGGPNMWGGGGGGGPQSL